MRVKIIRAYDYLNLEEAVNRYIIGKDNIVDIKFAFGVSDHISDHVCMAMVIEK